MITGSITNAPPSAGSEARKTGDRPATPVPAEGSAPKGQAAPAPQPPPARDAAPPLTEARKRPVNDGQSLRDNAEELARRISEQIRIERRSLAFEVNDSLGTTVVSVIDRETDEVIRQIPSEEFIRIAEAIRDLNEDVRNGNAGTSASGLLLDAQA